MSEEVSDKSKSISRLLVMLNTVEASEKLLCLMRAKHPSILALANEDHPTEALNDILCQHVAELGLKNILDVIKSVPVSSDHLYAGSVLVAIKDIHIVKRYIWKDRSFVPAMARILAHGLNHDENMLFRDIVIATLQGLVLGGTPSFFFTAIINANLMETYTQLLQDKRELTFAPSYEKLVLSLLVMCQDNPYCLERSKQLQTADVLAEFCQWDELPGETREKSQVAGQCIDHLVRRDELPHQHKVVLNSFTHHVHTSNKAYKRTETVTCSYRECTRVQPYNSVREGRFKKCGRCRMVVYCSKECQKSHWITGHMDMCVAPAGTGK